MVATITASLSARQRVPYGQQRLRHPHALRGGTAGGGSGRVVARRMQEPDPPERQAVRAALAVRVAVGHLQRPPASDTRARPPRECVAAELLARIERQPGADLDASPHRQNGAAVQRRPVRHGVVEIALDRVVVHGCVTATGATRRSRLARGPSVRTRKPKPTSNRAMPITIANIATLCAK